MARIIDLFYHRISLKVYSYLSEPFFPGSYYAVNNLKFPTSQSLSVRQIPSFIRRF